jgi:hypothetical protein
LEKKKEKKKGKKKEEKIRDAQGTYYIRSEPSPSETQVLVCWCFGGSARAHPLKHRFWWRLCKKEEREREREREERASGFFFLSAFSSLANSTKEFSLYSWFFFSGYGVSVVMGTRKFHLMSFLCK